MYSNASTLPFVRSRATTKLSFGTPCSMRRMLSVACVMRRISAFVMPACASALANECAPRVPFTISTPGSRSRAATRHAGTSFGPASTGAATLAPASVTIRVVRATAGSSALVSAATGATDPVPSAVCGPRAMSTTPRSTSPPRMPSATVRPRSRGCEAAFVDSGDDGLSPSDMPCRGSGSAPVR